MESFSLEEAKKIAVEHYYKLIERFNSKGYSNEVVELFESSAPNQEPNYYLRFYKDNDEYIDYQIKK